MSIPTPFNPMGTLGDGWDEVDMTSFHDDNWNDLASTSPPGLVPCGLPGGLVISTRNCTRSRTEGMLFFGFNYKSTTFNSEFVYNRVAVPPRNHGADSGTPALEFWSLARAMFLKLEFTLGGKNIKVFATRNDWENNADYEEIPVTQADGKFIVETPFKARSVIVTCGGGSVGGKFVRIYKK